MVLLLHKMKQSKINEVNPPLSSPYSHEYLALWRILHAYTRPFLTPKEDEVLLVQPSKMLLYAYRSLYHNTMIIKRCQQHKGNIIKRKMKFDETSDGE